MLSCPTLLKSVFAAMLVSGLTQIATAADQPEAQPQTPAGQAAPVRPHRPDPIHSRQVVQVVEVENADDLTAKLQAILDSGVNINSLQNVTANGKSLVVVIGFPIPQPHIPNPNIPAPISHQGPTTPVPVPVTPQPAPVTAPVPAPVPAK